MKFNLKFVLIGIVGLAVIVVPLFLFASNKSDTPKIPSKDPEPQTTALIGNLPRISTIETKNKVTKSNIEPFESKTKTCTTSGVFVPFGAGLIVEAKGKSGGGSGSRVSTPKAPSAPNKSPITNTDNKPSTNNPPVTKTDNTADWYKPKTGAGTTTTKPNTPTGQTPNNQTGPGTIPNNNTNQNNFGGGGMFGGQRQGFGFFDFLIFNSLFNNIGGRRNQNCTEKTTTLYNYSVEDTNGKRYDFGKNLTSNTDNPNNFREFTVGKSLE
jgi:hypothetical protein